MRDVPPTAIGWVVELEIARWRGAAFAALTTEMTASAQHERGVLVYSRLATEDGGTVHGIEVYADSEAACAHLELFNDRFAGQFLALVTRRRCTVYGPASENLRERLRTLAPVYLPVRIADLT